MPEHKPGKKVSQKPPASSAVELAQFSRTIAHDFNNLLCSILGNAELLNESAGSDAKLKRRAQSIWNAASRGVELTRKLAGFGACENVQSAALHPCAVLAEDLKWFEADLPPTMGLTVDIGEDLILFSEAPALQQIVGELLCNAREFSKPSGQIHLEIQVDEEGNGLLRVSDTGPGFPPEFDSSELVRAFVSTKKPGKGVGLAAVHSRILAHGGHLRLFNNGGAVVECFFPAVPSVVAPSQDPLDVWVVEDEPALLDFIVDVLESKGFKVLAFSGAEALLEAYVVDAHDPDVLLLDVVLPGTSGPELHRALQQRGFDSAVLWSSGFTADAAELVIQGQSAFLQKPYAPGELCRAIRALASQDRQPA